MTQGNKLIAIIAIVGATTLFAATNLKEVDVLVEKINTTTDQKERTQLLDKLDALLSEVDQKDIKQAHEIVNKKLKVPTKSNPQ